MSGGELKQYLAKRFKSISRPDAQFWFSIFSAWQIGYVFYSGDYSVTTIIKILSWTFLITIFIYIPIKDGDFP